MQKAMYPCKTIRITQKDHEGTHIACWAVDEAGIDGGISNFIMTFDGVVRKIYTADANEVWVESLDKVEYPDGTIDYMTIMFAHDNDVSNLYVGQVLKAGTVFYQEGTKGKAYGNHVHFECGKGKFTGSGWYQDSSGAWSIVNGKKVTDCLWIDDTYKIYDTRGYNFKKIVKYYGTPVERNENVNQIRILDGMTTVRARNNPNGDILGYMNIGLYNSLEIVNKDGFEWHRVEDDLWFAFGEWAEYLPLTEKIEDDSEQLRETIALMETEIKKLNETINDLQQSLSSFKHIYSCQKDGKYQIYLYEGENLYIKKD